MVKFQAPNHSFWRYEVDDHSGASSNPYLAPKATVADVVAAPGENVLAGRLTRLGASIIDGLIQFLVVLLIMSPIFSNRGFEGITVWMRENPFLSPVLSAVIGFAVYSAVNFHLLRKNSQTIGKYLCGIKIVRSDGSTADVQRILFYRYLPVVIASQVPVIGGLIVFIDPLFSFRESRKCLHDEIADTIVIKA
jgi:uncharacterized RDD family membrane protein YckC